MSKKYSFVEFLQQVKAHNDNYDNIEIISAYIDTHSPLSCRCKICGNEWNVVEAKELYYGGCSKCGEIKRAKSKTFTHERYLIKLDEQGFNYGWCNNSDVKNRAQRKANKKSIHIEVRNDNINYHCIFISMTECARQLTKLLGVNISLHKIDNRCKTGKPIGDYYFKKITITNNERSVNK